MQLKGYKLDIAKATLDLIDSNDKSATYRRDDKQCESPLPHLVIHGPDSCSEEKPANPVARWCYNQLMSAPMNKGAPPLEKVLASKLAAANVV
jgi:hypothetical protein